MANNLNDFLKTGTEIQMLELDQETIGGTLAKITTETKGIARIQNETNGVSVLGTLETDSKSDLMVAEALLRNTLSKGDASTEEEVMSALKEKREARKDIAGLVKARHELELKDLEKTREGMYKRILQKVTNAIVEVLEANDAAEPLKKKILDGIQKSLTETSDTQDDE